MVYYLSMMTQVDELFKRRHMEMSFVEFLEALCRAIDMSSPVPIKEEGDEGHQGHHIDPRKLPLQNKLMNAFKILIKLCPPLVQQNFEFPTFDSIEMMKYRKPNS
mmetsp:Transcript_25885/g.4380  ORF Transcript_25885/g.4380 Transcript_25885/m.4380 type:complete len:105 (+) Transcript_25885:261-575(+)